MVAGGFLFVREAKPTGLL